MTGLMQIGPVPVMAENSILLPLLLGAAAVCVLLLAAFLIRSSYERRHFTVTHYEVKSPKVTEEQDGYTIVMLADLHNNEFGPGNRKLTDAIKREAPDLVLIAGDAVTVKRGSDVDLESFRRLLEGLKEADCPVYFTRGNHEDRLVKLPEVFPGIWGQMTTLLDRYGVIHLNNEQTVLPPKKGVKDGKGPVLASYEIPREGYRKIAKKNAVNEEMIRQAIGIPLSSSEEPPFVILSAHSPLFGEAYSDWGADLTVSGHFHGGTIRLPFVGGLMTPQFHFFHGKERGMFLLKQAPDGPKYQITSGGLGTHSINLRFRNMSELVVIRLKHN